MLVPPGGRQPKNNLKKKESSQLPQNSQHDLVAMILQVHVTTLQNLGSKCAKMAASKCRQVSVNRYRAVKLMQDLGS